MQVRRDHVAGGAIAAAGAAVLAVSGDLPFGTLASPGAGMLPTIVTVLMMGFAAILVLGARDSPPIGEIDWSNLAHAACLAGITAAAVASYTRLGFIPTMLLLLLVLTFVVERKPLLHAILFSAGATTLAYLLFQTFLRAPLPRGILW